MSDPRDPLVSGDYEGWWRRSFALLRAGWRPMAAVQVIVTLPMLVVTVPPLVSYERHQRDAQESSDLSVLLDGLPLLLGGLLVGVLLYSLGQLATAQLVVNIATGRTGGLGPAVAAAARRIPALLGWYLLAVPLCLAAIILCFLPVLYVGAVLVILPVVVLLERGNGIGRCFQLFHANLGVAVGRIATILGLHVAAFVVMGVLSTVVSETVGGGLESPNTTGTVVDAVLQGCYYVAVALVGTPLLVTAYADMRARREPFSTAHLRPEPA